MSCKKCDSPQSVILRKKDHYCDNCFMVTTNHKFRACIGKNKVISPNENVLICLSGGAGSTVLLDLVHHGISLDNCKKLRIVPYFLHLYDDDSLNATETVLKQCKRYNCDVYVVHMSDYLNTNVQLPEANCIPNVESSEIRKFHNMLNCMPSTVANDFLLKVKRNLFIHFAQLLKCKTIFTAETTNTLAIHLLSNLAMGRGSQVQNDIGFSDNRDEKVKILRPIKDISKEELDYYVKIKQLEPVCNNSLKNNSLQTVITSFVSDLQKNFQSTISTVCKTADKIGEYDTNKTQEKCLICKSDFNTKDMKLSALEATIISRTVSYGNNDLKRNLEDNSEILSILNNNNTHTSMFPLLHKDLCYGCSRNNSEMSPQPIQQH